MGSVSRQSDILTFSRRASTLGQVRFREQLYGSCGDSRVDVEHEYGPRRLYSCPLAVKREVQEKTIKQVFAFSVMQLDALHHGNDVGWRTSHERLYG